jgi:hypothetical protein
VSALARSARGGVGESAWLNRPVVGLQARHDVLDRVKAQIQVMTTVCRLRYLQCPEWQPRSRRSGIGQLILSRTARGLNR